MPDRLLTDEQLKVLAEWTEGDPAWYRAECFQPLYESDEFDLMRSMAKELLERRA